MRDPFDLDDILAAVTSGELMIRLEKTCPCAQSEALSLLNFGSQRFTSAGHDERTAFLRNFLSLARGG